MSSYRPYLEIPTQPLFDEFPRFRRGFSLEEKGYPSDITRKDAEKIRLEDSIAAQFLRPLFTSDSLLYGSHLWCLWLDGVDEETLYSSPELTHRLKELKKLPTGPSPSHYALRERLSPTPLKRQPPSYYFAISLEVDESNSYLPVVRLSKQMITNQTSGVIAENEHYVAALLSSRIFQLWKLTALNHFALSEWPNTFELYQTFPVPEMSTREIDDIEHNFDRLLRTRSNFVRNSVGDLYNPAYMPDQLTKAHQRLDAAIFAAYRINLETPEDVICEQLFQLHQQLSTTSSSA
jgi:hypothetical protein